MPRHYTETSFSNYNLTMGDAFFNKHFTMDSGSNSIYTYIFATFFKNILAKVYHSQLHTSR